MQQRQKKKQAMRRFAASLTAAVLAAASLPGVRRIIRAVQHLDGIRAA